MPIHDFQGSFDSVGDAPEALMEHLQGMIAGATGYRKATEAEDLEGTDYWILRGEHLPAISIDVKWRRIALPDPPDACIETCSRYTGRRYPPFGDDPAERQQVGWTLDATKRTDLVVYTWPRMDAQGQEIGRDYWVVYFPLLCKVAQENWRTWREQYTEKAAPNRGYQTLNVFPPIDVVRAAMHAATFGLTYGFSAPSSGRGNSAATPARLTQPPSRGAPTGAAGDGRHSRSDQASSPKPAANAVGATAGDPVSLLKSLGLQVIDKRPSGCLWVIGGAEIRETISSLSTTHGWRFQHAPNGGRATDRRAAWFLKKS